MGSSGNKHERFCVVQAEFREDLLFWVKTDRKIAKKILTLIEEVMRDPYKGTGKPEPLKFAPNTWSRRITQEHRMVYLVSEDRIDFLQARYHY